MNKNDRIKYQAEEVCREFTVFCDYALQDKVKLSKRTGYLGKQDCFELNSLLKVQENYEKPTRIQENYPIIHYFYYVAVRYQILEMNEKGTGLIKGENYERFQATSAIERSLFFLFVLIVEDRFLKRGQYLWPQFNALMDWGESCSPVDGETYVLPNRIVPGYEGGSPAVIMTFLEEMGVFRVKERAAYSRYTEIRHWKIEICPLFYLIYDIYKWIFRKNQFLDEEELKEFMLEQYIKKKFPEEKTGNIMKMFEKAERDYPNQVVDLEIRVRYTKCVRAIRLNLSDSLYTLHSAIQEAVEFDDDHLFAYYVGNGMLRECYVMEETMTSGEELPAENTRMGDIPLRKGMKFTYLFDFGDMWWFDIKVLQISEGSVETPQILKSVGPSPQQYPDWDE